MNSNFYFKTFKPIKMRYIRFHPRGRFMLDNFCCSVFVVCCHNNMADIAMVCVIVVCAASLLICSCFLFCLRLLFIMPAFCGGVSELFLLCCCFFLLVLTLFFWCFLLLHFRLTVSAVASYFLCTRWEFSPPFFFDLFFWVSLSNGPVASFCYYWEIAKWAVQLFCFSERPFIFASCFDISRAIIWLLTCFLFCIFALNMQ